MRYSLVGVDGNAFAVMGYTKRALKESGHGEMVEEMMARAMSGDYNNLLCTCLEYIDVANESEEEPPYDYGDEYFREHLR